MSNFDRDLFLSIKKITKILLHTHLEGSTPLKSIGRICRNNNIEPVLPNSSKKLAQLCRDGGWSRFISLFCLVSSFFKQKKDFVYAITEYARTLHDNNVLYAEIHCTPWLHLSRGVGLNDLADGLISGIEAAKALFSIELRFILDLVRDPDEDCCSILSLLKDLPRTHFIALGISGGEDAVPHSFYKAYCDEAKDLGLRIVAHAGELEGPSSIGSACTFLGVSRICHGIRLIEDPALLKNCKYNNIHFELCPSSNDILGTGLKNLMSIKAMLDSGLSCSINTDDELFFNTDLSRELYLLYDNGIISPINIFDLQLEALRASFIADECLYKCIEDQIVSERQVALKLLLFLNQRSI